MWATLIPCSTLFLFDISSEPYNTACVARDITAGLILLLGGLSAHAQEVCYAYDGLGRLIAAMDPLAVRPEPR